MPFVRRVEEIGEDQDVEEIEIPSHRPPWEQDADGRWHRFLARARDLADKSAHIASMQHETESDSRFMDVDSEDSEDLKERESAHEEIVGSLWKFGDEEKKSGCAWLAKIIREFAKMIWDPLNAASPFPNCVRLGLSFLMNLVSEEIMDFILDLIRWWQEEDVTFRNTKLPKDAKEMKRENKSCIPDMSKFVGVSFTRCSCSPSLSHEL